MTTHSFAKQRLTLLLAPTVADSFCIPIEVVVHPLASPQGPRFEAIGIRAPLSHEIDPLSDSDDGVGLPACIVAAKRDQEDHPEHKLPEIFFTHRARSPCPIIAYDHDARPDGHAWTDC